jgi:hypothetical protein
MHWSRVRLVATLLAATFLAGCEGPTATLTPLPSAAAQVATPPPESSVPSPLPPSPSPAAPTEPPATLGPWSPAWTIQAVGPRFDVVWQRVAGADVPVVGIKLVGLRQTETSWAELDGTYGFTYRPSAREGPHLWRSTDLTRWRSAIPRAEWQSRVQAHVVVRGGPGLVALGADDHEDDAPSRPALWLTSDGVAWERVADERVPPVRWLYGHPGGLIAFGADTWASTNGADWNRVGPSPVTASSDVAVVLDVLNSALVFVNGAEEVDDELGRPIRVLRLDPSGRWQDLGEIPGSAGQVEAAVLGPQGLVVLGAATDDPHAVWRSTDALSWQRATRPPRFATFGSGKIAATATGYVIVSAWVYFEGCAGSIGGAQIPETWTSVDGLRWRRVADPGTEDHQELSALIGQGDALIAAGYSWPDSGFEGATPTLWRAEVRVVGDSSAGTSPPDGGGCQ